MARMTGGGALVEMLRQHGVDTVFALPGVQNDALFVAFYDAGEELRVIHTRHEQGAAYMAYGYARSSGKVGAYAVVPGPGLLNTTAALATAYATNAPVLCISGQIVSDLIGRGFGLLHEIPDQLGILQRLTKWAARIEHPTQTGMLVNEAFRQLRNGRPRPVGLEIPPDVLALATEVVLPPADIASAETAVDAEQIDQAAALLADAKKPLLFVGIVADAKPALAALHQALERRNISRPSRQDELETLKARTLADLADKLGPQCEYLKAIRAELPEDGIYVEDLTQVGYVGRIAFPVYRPRSYIHSGYQGTLGFGFATALGAKVGRPDLPVVSVSGDGGF